MAMDPFSYIVTKVLSETKSIHVIFQPFSSVRYIGMSLPLR